MPENNKLVPIVIPSFEPDARLIELLEKIDLENNYVILVDDGSGDAYRDVFDEAEKMLGESGTVLRHDINRGKGRALKTAFSYVLEELTEAAGVVTADSDGQHTPAAIENVKGTLLDKPSSLVLGVRVFTGDDVPRKSRFGNELTKKVMGLVVGLKISDTQTGLRGIPRSFMKTLLEVPGERFEFETQMLVESYRKYPITEVPIETIYDSKEAHQTHFNPLKDSIKIYLVLFKRFGLFMLSSVSSFVIDIALFTLFCYIFKPNTPKYYVYISTVLARVISAIYNYMVNYKFVFENDGDTRRSAMRYAILAVIQMSLSAIFTNYIAKRLAGVFETLIKLVVDTVLFILSYQIQKNIVFTKKRDEK